MNNFLFTKHFLSCPSSNLKFIFLEVSFISIRVFSFICIVFRKSSWPSCMLFISVWIPFISYAKQYKIIIIIINNSFPRKIFRVKNILRCVRFGVDFLTNPLFFVRPFLCFPFLNYVFPLRWRCPKWNPFLKRIVRDRLLVFLVLFSIVRTWPV